MSSEGTFAGPGPGVSILGTFAGPGPGVSILGGPSICTCGRSSGMCYCYRQPTPTRDLSGFSDEEIAREYHLRALRKLGDQMVGVSVPAVTDWLVVK